MNLLILLEPIFFFVTRVARVLQLALVDALEEPTFHQRAALRVVGQRHVHVGLEIDKSKNLLRNLSMNQVIITLQKRTNLAAVL